MSAPMLQLRRRHATPPGGWRCICPCTDTEIEGGDFDDLIGKCGDLLIQRHLPVPVDLIAQVEHAICQRQPAQSSACRPREKAYVNISLSSVVRFLRTLTGWFSAGLETVPQEEAERRALICKNCPRQVDVPGCFGCKGVGGLVSALKGTKRTAPEPFLKTCGVCGCYNSVQVWVPLEVLKSASGALEYPEHCWKR